MRNPDFESRQFVAYGLWRGHRLEFSRDGSMRTRFILHWSKEPSWLEKMAICRCVGGGLFDSSSSSGGGKSKQFFFLTKGTAVHDVLGELGRSGRAKLTYFRLVH